MAQQQPSTEPVQQKPHDPDEILHTPTKHRARWIMGILLLILILTTFTVGDEIRKLATGEGRTSAYVHWNRPGAGVQSVSYEEWQACLRSLSKTMSILGKQLEDKDAKERAARHLIVGALAQDQGVTVTDEELAHFILGSFGVTSVYEMALARFRCSSTEFEKTLRQELTVERYITLMGGAWNTPDIAEIETAWKKQHQEYAFDYIALPIASMLDDARKAPISDEELHAYFDGLPQPKKDSYKTKEKLSAELAGFPYEGSSPDALFAKFPKPTDEAEIEKQAKSYFDSFGAKRFAGKTYEEAKDRARSEALVYGSLQVWLADMRSREERGLAVNLGSDGSVLGLAQQHMPAALEQSEWVANKPAPWMGPQVAALLFNNATDSVAGKLYPKVIVDEGGFTLLQVYEKREAAIPPFEELADRLREELVQKRARDYALVRLEALRNKFGTRPETEPGKPAPAWMPEVEEAQFYDLARSSGFEPLLRDFKERMPPGTGEPPPAIDVFARMQPALYTAKVGAVLPAASDFEGKNAYVLRARGARDPDPARMKANDFASVSGSAKQAGMTEFHQKNFSLNALQTRYGLTFNEKQAAGE